MIKKITESSLFKNTGVYTITSILNTAIPFLMLPILTRYLSPQDYGIVSMFALLITFVSPFIGLSLNGAIARQYYNREEVDIWEYVGNCILILLVSTSIVSIIFFAFAGLIAQAASFPVYMLWTVIVFSFAQFLTKIVLSLLQVQKKALSFGIFNVSKTLLNMILSILLVVNIGLTWNGRIYAQLITGVVFALVAVWILVKKRWFKFSYNKIYIRNALLFGIPLIPHALSGSIISMTDRLFITNMVSLEATGVYTVGYQVGSIINILAMSFNNAYVPWLYEKLKQNIQKTKVKIVKFTYLYFIGIVVVALSLGFIAPFVLNVFLGRDFNESSVFVVWIAMGYAFNGMYLMVVNYIFYAQKNKYLALVTFITALMNLGLNYFFIKSYGPIGAAQATTLTFGIKFALVWIISAKVHKMPWKSVLLFRKSV